jgi:hypothetical protein
VGQPNRFTPILSFTANLPISALNQLRPHASTDDVVIICD